eukprot:GHUV01039202.1.p1 GENE.GHUV01039202.1~~GHUV01039202.1.p1  ORF type:complete len:117 (-),score=5.03 GHUV01039202.1:431-781(-)
MPVVMCICQVVSALWARIVHNAVDHLMAQRVTQPLQAAEAVHAVTLDRLLKRGFSLPSFSENDERVAVLLEPSYGITSCCLRQALYFAGQLLLHQIPRPAHLLKAAVQERFVDPFG